MLLPYEQRVASLQAEQVQAAGKAPDSIPADFQPWWVRDMSGRLRDATQPISIDIQNLVIGAIQHSPKIAAIRCTPEIRRTAIAEADATFDPQAFAESKLIDTNDPVGNTLTTGGPTRYLDQNVFSDVGVRQKTLWGGQLEVSQRFGYENSNSTYFTPPFQATARLSLSYTQPLLRGAGRPYNESVVVLAEIDASMALDEFTGALQTTSSHCIARIGTCTWNAWPICRNADSAGRLKTRFPTCASAATRRLAHAAGTGRIRPGDPSRQPDPRRHLRAKRRSENRTARQRPRLATLGAVRARALATALPGVLQRRYSPERPQALHHRPDLDQTFKQIRAVSLRLDVAANELLPVLNGVVTTYVSGLEGYGQIARAYGDEFGNGGPSYAAGLEFEMPLGNRAAKAHEQRRRMELCQFRCQLDQAVAQIVHDVEVAIREVDTSYREIQARYRAMAASAVVIGALQKRWQLLAGEEQVAGLLLRTSLQPRTALRKQNTSSRQRKFRIAWPW